MSAWKERDIVWKRIWLKGCSVLAQKTEKNHDDEDGNEDLGEEEGKAISNARTGATDHGCRVSSRSGDMAMAAYV